MFRLQTPASDVKTNEKADAIDESQIFADPGVMPSFPGGMGECMEFLAKNIKYPAEAQKAKIEGRVIVQFVVGKDGQISDAKVVRGVSPELDAEALRVVNTMPKWQPGMIRGHAVEMKYTIPVNFRLQTPAPKEETSSTPQMFHMNVEKDASEANVEEVKNQLRSQVKGMPVRGAEGKSPLVVVDGKEVGLGAKLISEIPVGTIQLISVLNEKNSVAKYGEKAKDGAIEVTTKKK